MPVHKINREEMDEVIVDLIAEKGYVACSMTNIAQAGGFAKSSSYHYADSKEQLVIDALKSYHFSHKQQMQQPTGHPSIFVVALVQCVLGAPPAVSSVAYDILLDGFNKPKAIDLFAFLSDYRRDFGSESSS